MINFSKDLRETLENSKKVAMRMHSTVLMPEHLFLGMISNAESNAYNLLSSISAPIDKIQEYLEDAARARTDAEISKRELERLSKELAAVKASK